jgi:hypothetical protein
VPAESTDGAIIQVTVTSGDARVSAYASVIDAASGDPWFLAAERQPAAPRRLVAPAITSSRWRSDLWLLAVDTSANVNVRFGDQNRSFLVPDSARDVLATRFGLENTLGALVVDLPPSVLAQTRVTTGSLSQGVPFQRVNDSREQHLPWVESNERFRTNIGLVTDGEATAEAVIYDDAGIEIERLFLVTERGVAQVPVTARVSVGRALVRILSGSASAYASVIDNRSGDATFVK